jgi:hypothetical protein
MMNRFKVPALASVAIVLPLLINGCSSDASNPLCCNEFKVGGTITADIGGSAESQVAAQAVADVSAIAASAVEDLTTACRGIAQDLDADKAKQDAASAETDANKRMNAWCSLAADTIGSVKASASVQLTVVAKPPVCEASISAKADCQAKCSGSAKCDIKANPPTCTGGKLEVACKGECTAKAGATLHCEGSCTAECKGSCTAQGGVKCAGKCEGTCEGAGGAGTSGVDAEGNCQGTCKGTCAVTAPGVNCTGSCNGDCSGSCKAEGSASVKCDGDCKADFEPISCSGGKLEGGCKVEAKCDANCDASVKAKAHCDPPSVDIAFTGAANATAAGKLVATLKANLPLILGIQAKLKGVADVTGSFSANVGAVVDIKAACIPPLVAAAGKALEDIGASVSATATVTGKIG